MFKNITIGQYILADSPIHKADPRLKLILTIALIVILFIISTPSAYFLFLIFTFIVVILSKIHPAYIIKGLKPILIIAVFTVVLNLFLTPGNVIWSAKLLSLNFSITTEGIRMSILMFLRLTLLVTTTSLLTLTTSPMQLTDGIESILKPLNIIKAPSHEIAMMMSIAIRFIPTFAEETDKIMKAQKARGADFESGNIIKRAKAMIPLLVPLFVSAFRRADELATAMDARCYNGSKKRTRMKEMKLTKADFLTIIIFTVFIGTELIFQFII